MHRINKIGLHRFKPYWRGLVREYQGAVTISARGPVDDHHGRAVGVGLKSDGPRSVFLAHPLVEGIYADVNDYGDQGHFHGKS